MSTRTSRAPARATVHTPLPAREGRPTRVLVVGQQASLTDRLSLSLGHQGWQVRTASDGASALAAADDLRPDLVVLDLTPPGMEELEVFRRLRAGSEHLPVLFLTAEQASDERIAGLTAGGDDYLSKPFSVEELVHRLRGLLRRSDAGALRPALTVGDLTLNEESHEAFRGRDRIHLTATEFELLRFLMRNPRRVLSKAQILDRVWNYDFGGQANIVELYISYLRKKIDAGRPPMIHTVRGFGYVLRPASP